MTLSTVSRFRLSWLVLSLVLWVSGTANADGFAKVIAFVDPDHGRIQLDVPNFDQAYLGRHFTLSPPQYCPQASYEPFHTNILDSVYFKVGAAQFLVNSVWLFPLAEYSIGEIDCTLEDLKLGNITNVGFWLGDGTWGNGADDRRRVQIIYSTRSGQDDLSVVVLVWVKDPSCTFDPSCNIGTWEVTNLRGKIIERW